MTDERALTVRQPQGLALDTMGDLLSFGKVMVESGMFPDVKSQAQAVVKIVAGRELGLAPLYSLRKIYVINGQVTLSADAMASLIKRSGEYDYQVLKLDDSGCSVQFTKGGQPCGPPSTFTADDAKTAGLTGGNWVKFRRNMMFARALSNGARWYCPHIIGGTYTPDELGGSVNEDGEPEPPQTAVKGASRSANVDVETGEIVEGVAASLAIGPMTAAQKKRIWDTAHNGLGWDVDHLEGLSAGTFDGKELAALNREEADQLSGLLADLMDAAAKGATA